MPGEWPPLAYEPWSATCDTLHAHTQILGKLAVRARPARAAAPARRPAAHARAAGRRRRCRRQMAPGRSSPRSTCAPTRPRGAQRRARDADCADAAPAGGRGDARGAGGRRPPGWSAWRSTRRRRRCRGRFRWTRTASTRPTRPIRSTSYFAAATQAALVLAEFRAPYRGRSTPVNAWWGTFDLAVSFFSGRAGRSTVRRLHHAQRAGMPQQIGIGWWPGDPKYERAAFFALAYPTPRWLRGGRARARRRALGRGARRVRARLGGRPLRAPIRARSPSSSPTRPFSHACAVCEWDPALAASAKGDPPPIR